MTAHKLLARKRPHLLPVYDSVLRDALQGSTRAFWLPLRNELLQQGGALVDRLAQLRDDAGLPPETPLLRVLDVAVWMRNFGYSFLPADERDGIAPLGLGQGHRPSHEPRAARYCRRLSICRSTTSRFSIGPGITKTSLSRASRSPG